MNRIKGGLHSKPSKRKLKHSFLTFLHKKISELSTLCGCEILFIIFSP
ncbi:hypothetical protein Goshw_018665, partial [Gossypium schwendimanii]|nr:hypothetical protein [Gossypium schwendimanii]